MFGIRQTQEPAYYTNIYIAGDLSMIRHFSREYCMATSLCVTVTPTDYVYPGVMEAGAIVGLVNYPRFPVEPEEIERCAIKMARILIVKLQQRSAMVQTPDRATWLTRWDDE